MNVNPFSYLIEKLKGKVDKSGDTMSGRLIVDQQNGTAGTVGYSVVEIGNNISQGTANNSCGIEKFYSKSSYSVDVYAPNLTADRTISFPDNSGTLALMSDVFMQFKGVMGDDIPSRDFNDYTTNGWYENTGTNQEGTANAPHSGDNGYLLVVSKSRTVYQFWFSNYQGNGVVFRKRYVGTWSAWTVVIS